MVKAFTGGNAHAEPESSKRDLLATLNVAVGFSTLFSFLIHDNNRYIVEIGLSDQADHPTLGQLQ